MANIYFEINAYNELMLEDREPEWAKYITVESIDDPGLLYLMTHVDFEAIKKLIIYYAGDPVAIPKRCNMKYKHQYILDTYDGTKRSRVKIVRECNITEGYIYKVIKKYKKKNMQ